MNHIDKEHQDGTPLIEIKCFEINQPFEVYYKGEKVLVSKLTLQAGISGKHNDRSFQLEKLDLNSGTFNTVGESTPAAKEWNDKQHEVVDDHMSLRDMCIKHGLIKP